MSHSHTQNHSHNKSNSSVLNKDDLKIFDNILDEIENEIQIVNNHTPNTVASISSIELTTQSTSQTKTTIASNNSCNKQQIENASSVEKQSCFTSKTNRERMQLIIATIFAMIDVATDTNLVINWFIEGEYFYAIYQLSWMLIANLFSIEIIMAFKPKYLFIEIVLTLTGFAIPLAAIHSWSTITTTSTMEKFAMIRNSEALFEALPTMIIQILFLMNSSSFELPILLSVSTSLFSLAFSSIKKSRNVYKIADDKFDKTYVLCVLCMAFDYIFRSVSFLLFVLYYNEWYYILISITIIIIIEMIFVYYHSKSYSSDVELEGWSGTFNFILIYTSNVAMGVFSTCCYMFFYVFLKKRHNAFAIKKTVVFSEYYIRLILGIVMIICVEYNEWISFDAIFDDLWMFIAVISGLLSFTSYTLLVLYCD